ncbi:hypothetical protein [Rubrivirga sp. IMCC45206]|uniref:hypothetical protein n=1 Tax=Rubrivirga sp. IMCC45206 TaxID=3391614 RepID=UPI00398FA111
MARFLCAVHAPNATPRAYALVEVMDGPTYAVRDLRRVSGDDPIQSVLKALNSERQYAGQTTVVTTGGQKAADAIHAVGPSAVAVHVGSGNNDAHDVSAQVLVDTFEGLYRAGAVDAPGSIDAASEAVEAMYAAADLEAAAPDSDRNGDGDIDASEDGASTTLAGTSVAGSGPSRAVIEQSGNAANVSTEVIDAPLSPDEATAMRIAAMENQGRVAADTGATVDLGDHEDVSLALALACWYGEVSRDGLPQTDQADRAMANRVNRRKRKN